MANKPTDHLGSFAKGLRVIECFGSERPRLTTTDVAQSTGLDRASARRCLLTLHAEGYADYDGKFFSLTPRALRLGLGALASLPLPRIVQPWLDQLTEQIEQSCSVSILDGTEIVYLARAVRKRVMSITLMPGSRLPAYCTSMGRIMLAALPDEEVRALLERSILTPRTSMTLTDPLAIMDRIAEIRVNGYAVIDQEIELGLRSIAVPVFDTTGKTLAALNTGMAVTGDSIDETTAKYLPALLRTQAGLARVLARSLI